MRVFLAQRTGTGTPILVSIDPYVDENGDTITEAWINDPIRPDAVIDGGYIAKPLENRNRSFFLVVAETMTVAPAGTHDLGDLQAPSFDNVLTNQHRNNLASFFGVPNTTFTGFTYRQALSWVLNDATEFVVRFNRQNYSIIGGV